MSSRLLADLTPLRVSAPYRRMWLGTSLSGVGAQLTTVAVGLQVYDITGSTFSVCVVGLVALVPLVVMGLYGGSIIDAYDRRTVIISSAGGLLAVAALFSLHWSWRWLLLLLWMVGICVRARLDSCCCCCSCSRAGSGCSRGLGGSISGRASSRLGDLSVLQRNTMPCWSFWTGAVTEHDIMVRSRGLKQH